jgi:hypothetical protein
MLKAIKLSALVLLTFVNSSQAAEPVEIRDQVTGLTQYQKIVAERRENARQIANEPTSRPWIGTKGRELYGLPPTSPLPIPSDNSTR